MQQTSELLALTKPSRAAGDRLFVQHWMPDGAPKAIILLAHGYAEHAGRYTYFAGKCTAAGLAVCAIDHWGHGRSDGQRGFVPAFSVFLDGMAALVDHAETRWPGTPLVLVGHSMGGLIAATHLLDHQHHYQAAVLSGPAVKPGAPPSRLTRWIGTALSRLAPRTGLIQLDATAVSRDPDVVARYKADHLVYTGKMSARLAAEMLGAMESLQHRAADIRLPLLVVHGSEDRLASPEGGEELVQAAASPDKEFRLLQGLYHEVFNEPERDAVIGGVLSWISAHLSQPTK